jgi:hypothetical protein
MAVSGLVIDVPVYVINAVEVQAVDIRCSAFAQPLGDLVGTGHVIQQVIGGTIAEMVAVPISPTAGKTRSRAGRYSCVATYITDEGSGEERPQSLSGAADATERRAVYERRLGRAIESFSDLSEGDIDQR